jgi:hypothetical protein
LFVEEKAHDTNKNIDGLYTKTTQKGGFSKLYSAGKYWSLDWMEENQTAKATYFLRSRLFTYDIMKNFNCN